MPRTKTKVPEISPKPSKSTPRDLRIALGVILLLVAATIIRDVYILQYRAALPYYKVPALDAEYYDLWAQRVAAGKGYGPMPFYMAPLYPYFLALIYTVAGRSLPLVYAIQQAMGLSNLLLVYFIGRRLYGHAAGLVAVAMLMLYAPVVYLESKLLTETLGLTLNLIALLLIMRALDRPTHLRFAAAGVMLGVAALCRPPLLILIAFVAAWMLVRRKTLPGVAPAHVGVLVLGAILAITPATVRNYKAGGGFAFISTNSGIVFAQANNPDATGVSMPIAGFTTDINTQQQEEMLIASKRLGHPVNAFESSAYWFGYGLEFIREQPGRFALLLGKKAVWTLHDRESGCSYNVNYEKQFVPILRFLAMPFAAFLAFGLYGFVRDRRAGRSPGVELVMIQAASIAAGLIIFSVSSRYRTPAVPALAVLAGFGILKVIEDARALRLRRLIVAAAYVIPAFLISLVSYPIPPIMPSEPLNLGVTYVQVGEMGKALRCIGQALQMDPRSPLAHLNMGLALDILGKRDEAMEQFREGLKFAPEHENLLLCLAQDLVRSRRYVEAAAVCSQALRINGDNFEAHLTLGAACAGMGNRRDAIREFEEVVRLKPDFAPAHFGLAMLLNAAGEYRRAWRETHLSRCYGAPLPRSFVEGLSKKMPDPGD